MAFLNKNNYIPMGENHLKEEEILKIKNLNVSFKNKLGFLRAVRSIDLKVKKGQIVGLVGESGSGKSVSVKSVIGFNDGSNTTADCLNLDGISITSISGNQWQQIRGTKVAYIPQDPLMSLNPTKKINKQIIETIKITEYRRYTNALHELKVNKTLKVGEKSNKINKLKKAYKINTKPKTMKKRMFEILEFIGIEDAEKRVNSYPHEFSGGMRQRIAIAIAVACKPNLIIADEPTTALDVTIQAKVLDLIKKLRDELGVSIIFISHNIALVANFCDYIYVMYAGKIVERGTVEDIFTNAAHPYTWALIASIPDSESEEELLSIPGTPPNMMTPPKGDAFAPRNTFARKIDFEMQPPLFPISDTHSAATWLLHPDAPKQARPAQVEEKMRIAQKSLTKGAKQNNGNINNENLDENISKEKISSKKQLEQRKIEKKSNQLSNIKIVQHKTNKTKNINKKTNKKQVKK